VKGSRSDNGKKGKENKMTIKEKERAEFLENLREIIKPGMTVYTVLRHVSTSGMTRSLDVYIMENNRPRRITYWVAKALDYPLKDSELRTSGCGMDMGFSVVYNLGSELFHSWDCIGDRCPSNDHSNGKTLSTHFDGGYALRHEWL
jgi:hypothetical protein